MRQATEINLYARLFRHPRRAAWLLGLAGVGFLLAPWPLYDKLWAVAYGICPQRPGHSLFFGGVQMPIEARETGIFSGFVVGAITTLLFRRGRAREFPPIKVLVVLVSFIGLMGLDGLNALAYDFYLSTPYTPHVYLRLGTGLLAGLAIAGLVIPTFNQVVWRHARKIAQFAGWRDLGAAVLLVGSVFIAAVSGARWLLIPMSLFAIGGELALMTTLATVLTTSALRRSNQADSVFDLAPAILTGLLAAVLILGAISTARYLTFGAGSMPSLR